MQKLRNSPLPNYLNIRTIWRSLKWFYSINWHKTIYFNLRMLPLHGAIKLPVFFFGPIKFTSLKGKLVINAPLKRNMIRFGYNQEMGRSRIGNAELRIDGTLIINGNFITSNDYKILILKNATLEIGGDSHFGSRTIIAATNRVKLGKWFRLSYDSQVVDSNFHFLLNLENNKILRISGEITIGDYCWVGNRSSIMKGTVTPRNLIIASNSLLNKDYTITVPENSLIGGTPAELIKTNIVRVFDPELERKISNYFKENPQEEHFQLSTSENYFPDRSK
jgi:acetyltransferase-like isoleucine patch superfamily enzyme